MAGEKAGNIHKKLYGRIGWFFINISGLLNSFGLALFVVQDICVLLRWIPAGRLGKSLSQTLGGIKVPRLMTKNQEVHDLMTSDKANVMFQKQMLCADAQC